MICSLTTRSLDFLGNFHHGWFQHGYLFWCKSRIAVIIKGIITRVYICLYLQWCSMDLRDEHIQSLMLNRQTSLRWFYDTCGVSVNLYSQLSTGLWWIVRLVPQTLFLGRRVTCPTLLTTLSDWCCVWFPIIMLCLDLVFGLCKLEVWWPSIPFSASHRSYLCVSASLWPACHLHKICRTWGLLKACLPVCGQLVIFNYMLPHPDIAGSVSASVWPTCVSIMICLISALVKTRDHHHHQKTHHEHVKLRQGHHCHCSRGLCWGADTLRWILVDFWKGDNWLNFSQHKAEKEHEARNLGMTEQKFIATPWWDMKIPPLKTDCKIKKKRLRVSA